MTSGGGEAEARGRGDAASIVGPSVSASPRPRVSASSVMWLLALSLVLCLVLLVSPGFSAAVPLILKEWDISAAEVGLIFSAYQVGYVAAVFFLVPLTDRVPARKVLVASALASTLGNLAFPFLAWSTGPAVVARAVAGAGLVGVYMPGIRLVAERFTGEWRGTAVAVYVSAFYLGSSLSLGATAALLPLMGWRDAFLALAVLSLLAPVIAFLLLRGASAQALVPGKATTGLSRAVLANRPALLAIGAYAAHGWELYIARAWLAPFLAAVLATGGASLVDASVQGSATAAIMLAAGVLGVPLGGFLSDRLGRVSTAAAITALSAVGSLALGWLGHLPWEALLVAGLAYGLLVAADSPIYSTAVTELSLPGQLGATQAVQAFLGFGATTVAPVLFGLVLDVAPPEWGWGLGFGLSGLVGLAGLAALLALGRHPRSRSLAGGRG